MVCYENNNEYKLKLRSSSVEDFSTSVLTELYEKHLQCDLRKAKEFPFDSVIKNDFFQNEMGKVRKLRQKYHLSTKKSKSLNNLPEVGEQKNGVEHKEHSFSTIKENIFAGVDISWDDIGKSLPKDFDVRSTVSSKSRKDLKEEERHLKKRDKKKLRHQRFIQKLDVTHKLIKNSKSKKKNKRKNSGHDMSSLLDALPSLESIQEENSEKKCKKPKTKSKGTLKAKQRLKQQSIDRKVFKQILNDKIFKENPLQAITQYLRHKVSEDR